MKGLGLYRRHKAAKAYEEPVQAFPRHLYLSGVLTASSSCSLNCGNRPAMLASGIASGSRVTNRALLVLVEISNKARASLVSSENPKSATNGSAIFML